MVVKLAVSLVVFGAMFWVAYKVENRLGILNGRGGN